MTEQSNAAPSRWHKHVHRFDIDNYLNRFVPRPRFYLLPNSISYFFGYRSPNAKPKPAPSNPIVWVSALIGGFVGIAIVTSVYHALPLLGGQQVPIVIASFGAAAILEYNTIESPLSQPRNLIVGHLLSALVGVAITKGFERLPTDRFDELRWLAGSISVGVASAVMSITKTVHPPAGATALLASTSPEVTVLSWWLLPLVLLASCLMTASALLINNLTRRWPLYWWTPVDLSAEQSDVKHVADVERSARSKPSSLSSNSTGVSHMKSPQHIEDNDFETKSESTLNHNDTTKNHEPAGIQNVGLGDENTSFEAKERRIVITPESIILPDYMEADEWEMEVLEIFKQKLQKRQQA